MDERPIGVTDSGLGGVSVLRTLVRVLPRERYIYLGDTKNAPYGEKSESEICALETACVERLTASGVKAIVIACNTATSAAAQTLRERLEIPIIGVEPALKPAALSGRSGKVLVMATTATLRQRKFQRLMETYGRNAEMTPCPGLMEFVERGELDSPALDAYLAERFAPYRQMRIASVVLGCTHYVFLRRAIARALPGAKLFDGNLGTANRLKSVLELRDQLAPGPGGVQWASTDPAAISQMQALFALPQDE